MNVTVESLLFPDKPLAGAGLWGRIFLRSLVSLLVTPVGLLLLLWMFPEAIMGQTNFAPDSVLFHFQPEQSNPGPTPAGGTGFGNVAILACMLGLLNMLMVLLVALKDPLPLRFGKLGYDQMFRRGELFRRFIFPAAPRMSDHPDLQRYHLPASPDNLSIQDRQACLYIMRRSWTMFRFMGFLAVPVMGGFYLVGLGLFSSALGESGDQGNLFFISVWMTGFTIGMVANLSLQVCAWRSLSLLQKVSAGQAPLPRR